MRVLFSAFALATDPCLNWTSMCQNNNQSICAHFPHQTRSASLMDSSPARIQHVPYFSIRITHAGWMPAGYTANCIKALFRYWPCRVGKAIKLKLNEEKTEALQLEKACVVASLIQVISTQKASGVRRRLYYGSVPIMGRTNLDAGTDLVANPQKYPLSNFKVFSLR